ncbi:hypothetical protein F9C07_8832 [Aspergillus flavus]|uniref:Uncharacterized protein n=1 Tax=Aspergillus flavus (strain ATCC 200026 / FGSC A1120 / IAM 13836 / NRRL 3357 / JCM 12722 / SRRC 167) TaxID=332952 RepID=A0A7U2MIX1_ASPFN|nr:hypothetical protein F9C07_8832 [Aspergillus flavus]
MRTGPIDYSGTGKFQKGTKGIGSRRNQTRMCASSYMRSRLHPLVVVLTPSGTRKLIESMIIHRSEDDHQQVHGSAVDHENSHKLHGRCACLLDGSTIQ